MSNDARSFYSDQAGTVAVEFALIATLLIFCLIGLFDLGSAIHQRAQLDKAARAVMRYAYLHPDDMNAIDQAAQATAQTVTPLPSIALSQSCSCSGGGAQVSCLASASCGVGEMKEYYLNVQISSTFQPLIDYPGLPASIPLSSDLTARTK